ncbi:hypothetical protein DBR36_06185 [Microbacterium sp. HMWF026]|nr:hypothetical protein DBR36_06185 [Microbacterium sp. HMWF026]
MKRRRITAAPTTRTATPPSTVAGANENPARNNPDSHPAANPTTTRATQYSANTAVVIPITRSGP